MTIQDLKRYKLGTHVIYTCKTHSKPYTVCPDCEHQYCEIYWLRCPSCERYATGTERGALA